MTELNRESAMILTQKAEEEKFKGRKKELEVTIATKINEAINNGNYSCSFCTFASLLDIVEQKKEYEKRGFSFFVRNTYWRTLHGDNGYYVHEISIFWGNNEKFQRLKYFIYECQCGYKYASINKSKVYHCNKQLKGKEMHT